MLTSSDTFLQKSPFKFHEFDFHNCKYALEVVGIILTLGNAA